MYSDNGYDTVITDQALNAGGPDIVYTKVTSQGGYNITYYAVTINRAGA